MAFIQVTPLGEWIFKSTNEHNSCGLLGACKGFICLPSMSQTCWNHGLRRSGRRCCADAADLTPLGSVSGFANNLNFQVPMFLIMTMVQAFLISPLEDHKLICSMLIFSGGTSHHKCSGSSKFVERSSS
uniref:RRB1 n=1 Tax=Arundo donax TaxID=35708 RepID=A0A0A9FFL1_ARUDO